MLDEKRTILNCFLNYNSNNLLNILSKDMYIYLYFWWENALRDIWKIWVQNIYWTRGMNCEFGYIIQQENLGFYSCDNEIYENVPFCLHFFFAESNRLTYMGSSVRVCTWNVPHKVTYLASAVNNKFNHDIKCRHIILYTVSLEISRWCYWKILIKFYFGLISMY